MLELLLPITYWTWLIIGVVFIIIELFVWSVFFLWLGISAILVGILFYFVPTLSISSQLLIFAVLSITSIYIAKKFWKVASNDTQLNNRASRHIGNTYSVVELNDQGAKVRVGDSLWLAQGCEMTIGQQVKVISVDSTVLIVEPASNKNA